MTGTVDFASLGIRVDTAEVGTGKTELDQFSASATRAAKATEALGPASKDAASEAQKVGAATRASVAPVQQQEQAIRAATLSARQYSQALRLLPAQITDIVTGLASGQNPFLVAIQQGGQLRDQFDGIGNAGKAILTILTPVRIAMLGVGGAAAALAAGLYQSQQEGYELAKSLVLTGNAAGANREQLADYAAQVDKVVGTQKAAAATIAALVSTGRVQSENLQEFATVAQQLERLGVPVEETVKNFAELGRRPVEAALKLNETMHFLTVETYEQIKALEQQGNVFKAGEIAQREFAAANTQRIKTLEEELGFLQKVARGTGDFFKEMWDEVLDIGRPDTLQRKIRELEEMQKEGRTFTSGFGLITDELTKLRAQASAADDAAKAERRLALAVEERVAREKEGSRLRDALTQQFEQAARGRADADLNAIQRALDASLNGYRAYTTALESLRSADLISEGEYFAAKRELVVADEKTRVSALQQEAARLRQESGRLQGARDTAGAAAFKSSGSQAEQLKAELPFVREINQNRQQLIDIEGKIAAVRVQSATSLSQLSFDERKAIDERTKVLREAQVAADEYVSTLARQNDRRLDAFGRGSRENEIVEVRNNLEDRFERQRQQLERERRRNPGDAQLSKQIDAEVAILRTSYDQALRETDRYYDQLAKRQSDATLGARAAVEDYVDSANDMAGATRDAITNAFESAEDALVEFARTGKLEVKDLVDSIIADFLRIQIRSAIANLAGGFDWGSLFGSFLGAFTGAPGTTAPGTGNFSGPRYDVGTTYVPRDQIALVHRGEAIIPKSMNPFAGGTGMGTAPVFHISSPVYASPGVSAGQVEAVVDQRNAELYERIMQSLDRGTWR